MRGEFSNKQSLDECSESSLFLNPNDSQKVAVFRSSFL